VKRFVVISALVAVAGIGLASPQIISAGPPGCPVPGKKVTTENPDKPSGRVGRLAPTAATAATAVTGCGIVGADEPDDVFLCYSKFQVEPGVWPPDVAAELLAAGYYYPVAVKGNVPGGTNLGDYHLVCNATPASSGEVVNANGIVMPAEVAGEALGYYPLGA
jgi:hypothetical protein